MSNIYLGLQSYKESNSQYFKGRQEDAHALFEQVKHNEYTVCYAKSGEGKTSLINAGLFPLLRRSLCFPISISFNQEDYENDKIDFNEVVLKRIDEAIEKYKEETGKKDVVYELSLSSSDFSEYESEKKNTLQKKLENKAWWKLRNYTPQIAGIDLIPVFIFDQFEEVFDRPKSIFWTKKFFAWLGTVSTDLCPNDIVSIVRDEIGADAPFPKIKKSKDFKAIFSLRNEFIGDLDYWCMQKFFIPDLKNNRFCLKPLTINGAKEIMGQGEFDTRTEFDVIKHLAGNEYSDTEQDVPCISALLLSIVCTSLSDKSDIIKQSIEVQNNSNDLVNHIITLFYQQSIENLKKEKVGENGEKYDEEVIIPKKHLKTIERALIDDNGKRIRISVTSNELKKIDFIENYLEPLENGRLIRITHFEGQDYVELIHDQLAKVISERVKKRTSQRVINLGASALFVFLLIVACVTLRTMAKGDNLIKHDLPTLHLDRERINHSSSISAPSEEKCVEELHLKLAKHSIISLKQLKRLYIEDNNSHQAQITVQDCPLLDEIHIDDAITELILNINDSVTNFNAVVFINPNLKKITINNTQNILTFVVPKENKNFIWNDNTLWNSQGEIVYVDPNNNKEEIEFPDAIKDQQSVQYEGKEYKNKNSLPYRDEYYYRDSVINSEEVARHPAKTIVITDRVKRIEKEAFKYQDSLFTIKFDADCLPSIGVRAFAYCQNLKKVKLPRIINDTLYAWWDNPFLECHNVEFELPTYESSNLKIDENGVVWRVGIIRHTERDTIDEPLFSPKGTNNKENIPLDSYYVYNNRERFRSYKNGVVDLIYGKVLFRTDLTELNISDYIIKDGRIEFYNAKDINKIYVCKSLPTYSLIFSDSDKSDITLVVPKGCKAYYENDDNFKGFRRIEEENRFWQPYYHSIKNEWWNTRYYIGEYWKLMLPILLVVIILYSVLIDFIVRFNNRRKGKEHLAITSRVLLILSYILLGFFSYTVFYWLFLAAVPWGDNAIIWCNVIAVPIAIIISLSMLYLSNVAGDWALFKSEWKSFLKKTKGKTAQLPDSIIQLIRKWWKLCTGIVLLGATAYGIIHGIKTIKAHNDLNKMIEEKDWKRVSQIVYNRIIDADNIDDIDRSWTRTLLLVANQDTISNGLDYSWYVPHSYSYYSYSDKNNKVYIVRKECLGIQTPLDTLILVSKPEFLDIISDRYLLYKTKGRLHCYDILNQLETFDIFVGSYLNEQYCSTQEVKVWTNNYKLPESTIFIFNGNTGLLDSIPFPDGYNYLGSLSAGRYLGIGNLFKTSGFYDLKTKTIIPKPNSVVGIYPQFISEKFGDTIVVSSTYKGELRKDTILDLSNQYSVYVGSNYLFYIDTLKRIQYLDYESNLKTMIGNGTILFKYDKYLDDSLLIISKSDTITAFQLAVGKPIKLAEGVNRIQNCRGVSLNDCMKKGIVTNKINDTVLLYHLLYGKELKAFDMSFDFNTINENFIIKYEEKTKYIELYPLDGSPVKTPIIIKTQNTLNKKYEVNTIEDYIVKTNSEFFILPSLEQTINNNVYLNENQKAKLIKKLKSTCK